MYKPGAVLEWLDAMDRARCTVWNPTDVIRWNLDKRYLLTLRELGVALPGTELLEPGQAAALRDVLARNGWGRAVVKPVIGGGAIGAFVAGTGTSESDDQARLEALLAKGAVLVQEFVEEVAGSGEISLMFIAGEYSHSVLKRPKAGDWRVQEEYGGAVEPLAPPREALAAARRLLEHAPGPLLYARVDGVMTPRGFLLMELELFEPQLFFPQGPGSAAKLAEKVTGILSPQGPLPSGNR
jgi:glutathione synthase/RimK-type ligase-like ATP-grasp enzyme